MTTPPKHRWFRFTFSLRTMFVLMTVFGVTFGWLVWQWQIVRGRRLACDSIQANGGEIYFPADFIAKGDTPPPVVVSPLRAWMGDVPVVRVTLPRGATADEEEQAKQLFPEAESIDVRWDGSGGNFF